MSNRHVDDDALHNEFSSIILISLLFFNGREQAKKGVQKWGHREGVVSTEERDLEYQRLACDLLGIVHPEDRDAYPGQLLELGTFRIIDSPLATKAVVTRYIDLLQEHVVSIQEEFRYHWDRMQRAPQDTDDIGRQRLQEQRKGYLDAISEKAILNPGDFYKFNGHGDAEAKREHFLAEGRSLIRARARMKLAGLEKVETLASDFGGYQKYLDITNPDLYFRLKRDLPVLVPADHHTTHTYVMSTTKTGKSELLKAFCLNYIQEPDNCSLLVLDPGGDMSKQIAQWPELIPTNRLIYFDPALNETHVPCINPFEVSGLTRREKSNLAGQITTVIGAMIEGKIGGSLSHNMEAILRPTIRLLIDTPNTSLADIIDVVNGDARFIALGQRSENRRVQKYFRNDFQNANSETKKAIVNKLNSILMVGELDAILGGKSTIDLKHALDNNMVVVANLAKGALDPDESRIIGQLLVAICQAIGMERIRLPERERPQTHLIVDECQNFVSSKMNDIIRETRKFGLSVTLAQQELAGGMPAELARTVTSTTNVKIAGRSAKTETRRTGDLVGIEPASIRDCGRGEFYYQAENYPAFKLRVRSDRVQIKGCISLPMWERVKQQQIERYYRPIEAIDREPRQVDGRRTTPIDSFPFDEDE